MNGTMNEQDFWQQGCVVQLDNHKTNRHFCPSDCKPRLSRQKIIFCQTCTDRITRPTSLNVKILNTNPRKIELSKAKKN